MTTRDDKLARLRDLRKQRGEIDTEVKALNKALLPELDDLGEVLFETPDGKVVAVPVHTTQAYVDLDALEECVRKRWITRRAVSEFLDQVVNNSKFEDAANAGRIPAKVVQKVVKERSYQNYVGFAQPS